MKENVEREKKMVKHMILWKLNENLSPEEQDKIKADMKLHLEALVGKVPGLLHMHIQIDSLASSNADVMLDSTLENAESLQGYATHPEHVYVADHYVRPFTVQRMCLDYEVE